MLQIQREKKIDTMNVQVVSNARNKVGGENFTNKFVMHLPTILDAETKNMHVRALNVSYPLTIENVHENKCGIHIRKIRNKHDVYTAQILHA